MMISSDSSFDYIRQSDLEEMDRQKRIDEVCSIAIKYIGIATKSSGRIRDYLRRKEIGDDLIEDALADLDRRGYLDDMAIALRIIRQRSGRKSASRRAVRYYMQTAGVPDRIIDEASSQLPSDLESSLEALKNKYVNPEGVDRIKMLRFLGSRGYDGGTASRAVSDFLDSHSQSNE